ncbi:ABC transporter substrate-binding protein [Atopobiaceae bacterium 24-176]
MKKPRLMTVLGSVMAAVLAVTLAACGGSPSSSNDQGQKPASSTTEDYALVEDGKLTMISNFYFPPFVSMSAQDSGDFEGFDVDVYKAVCDKLGLEPNILPSVQFDTIVPTIKQGGKADVSIGAITITDERLDEVDMTDPYMDSNQAIVVKKGAAATDVDTLNVAGTQVAVQSGTTGEAWVKENLPNATVVPLDDIIQCLTGLQSGLYGAVVCDLPVAQYEIKVAYSDLEVTSEIPTGEQYGIVVSKDNPGLTEKINQALKDLQDDGTIDQLEQKWFGTTL